MSQSKVKLAFLQSPSTVPGVFTSMTTLDKIKVPGIEMFLMDNGGLLIYVKNLVAYIPAANVKLALLEDEKKDEKIRK
jgi:hypothetical protein